MTNSTGISPAPIGMAGGAVAKVFTPGTPESLPCSSAITCWSERVRSAQGFRMRPTKAVLVAPMPLMVKTFCRSGTSMKSCVILFV